jgi:hypothetical protein
VNPYAPPAPPPEGFPLGPGPGVDRRGAPLAGGLGPTIKLHRPQSVALAAFLGSPLGGALLLADNERRLGRAGAAWATLAVGTLGTLVLVVVGAYAPSQLALPLALAGVFATRQVAIARHGAALAANAAAGTQSMWLGAAAGAASMVAVLGVSVLAAIAVGTLAPNRVAFPPADEVYYEDGATEPDARRLGEALGRLGFFGKTEGKTVTLAKKSGEGFVVSFIVHDGAWNDAATVQSFDAFGRRLSDEAFGGALIVEVQLCNDLSFPKKTIPLR